MRIKDMDASVQEALRSLEALQLHQPAEYFYWSLHFEHWVSWYQAALWASDLVGTFCLRCQINFTDVFSLALCL
jgi:hypothetical protein